MIFDQVLDAQSPDASTTCAAHSHTALFQSQARAFQSPWLHLQAAYLSDVLDSYQPPDRRGGPGIGTASILRASAATVQVPGAPSPRTTTRIIRGLPHVSGNYSCPWVEVEDYLVAGSTPCPSELPVALGFYLQEESAWSSQQRASLAQLLQRSSPGLRAAAAIQPSQSLSAILALSPADRAQLISAFVTVRGRPVTLAEVIIFIYRDPFSPLQREWVQYSMYEFNPAVHQQLLDHHDNWGQLTIDVQALPTWFQVALYKYALYAYTWTYAFIDTGARAPPPPPGGVPGLRPGEPFNPPYPNFGKVCHACARQIFAIARWTVRTLMCVAELCIGTSSLLQHHAPGLCICIPTVKLS